MSAHFGSLNEHLVGIAMKELVRRAIAAVRAERFAFEVTGKAGYDGAADMVTSADHHAQAIYLRGLRECFPEFGIVAEEDSLRVEPTLPGRRLSFTVDPVDGTRALVRRQSHGIGTMLALVEERTEGGAQVLAAWVGDVMTQEVYGFRPGSSKVHRISEFDSAETLSFDATTPLRERYVLLHDPVERHGPWIRTALDRRVFSGYEVMGGSVGIWMARLWKGEVGAAFLPPSHITPWDYAPVVGISAALGFRFLEVAEDGALEEIPPRVSLEGVHRRERDLLVVHTAHLEEVRAAMGG